MFIFPLPRQPAVTPSWRGAALIYLLVGVGAVAFDNAIFHIPTTLRMAVTLWLMLPVVAGAFLGGVGPALLAAAAAIWAFETYTWVLPPDTSPIDRWAVFLLIAIAIGMLAEVLHRARRKIEDAESLLSVTLASIGDAVIATDVRGRITYMNDVASRLSGWSAAAVRGQEFSSVFSITSLDPEAPAFLHDSLQRGDTVRVQKDSNLRTRSGDLLPVEASAAPLRSPQGESLGVVVTLRECAEQRRTEQMMRERLALQERLALIARLIPGALLAMRVHPDGTYVLDYASDRFRDVVGIGAESLRDSAQSLYDAIYAEDRAATRDQLVRAFTAMRPFHIDCRVLHPLKGLIWLELYGVPTNEADGSRLVNGILFDITQRKQMEERLRASQQQLRVALQASELGLVEVDLANGKVTLDGRAKELWGLAADDVDGTFIADILPLVQLEDREAFTRQYQAAVASLEEFTAEFRVTLGEAVRWLEFRGRVEGDSMQRASRLTGLIGDTTLRRMADESRLRSQKLEALGVLAGGIAHDFNNLLLVIAGNVRLLQLDLSAEHAARSALAEIDKAATRATALVRQILTATPSLAQKPEVLPLAPLLGEVMSFARAILPATVALHAQSDEPVPAVLADAGQVHQVLLNLLTNAADAVPESGGCIRVKLDTLEVSGGMLAASSDLRSGPYVRITVTDNGTGMDAMTLQRIFDPFFTTKPQGKGTGLGLSIVHRVMKHLDGAVVVSSTPGAGSTFALYFPVATAAPLTESSAPVQPSARAARILYVDDEEPLVFLMTRLLQRMGHTVEGCVDPQQALLTFTARPTDFDVLVTDMSMPGMSGFELAQAVLAVRKDLPVILTSGYLRPEDQLRAQQLGIRELVLKPNTIDEMGVVLNRCLG